MIILLIRKHNPVGAHRCGQGFSPYELLPYCGIFLLTNVEANPFISA